MEKFVGLIENCEVEKPETPTLTSNADSIENKKTYGNKKVTVASYVSKVALLSAVAVGLMFLQFPIFPLIPFIEMDFSCVCSLLGGMLLGFPAGLLIELMKFCLKILIMGTSTGGVGELSNLLISVSLLIIPSIMYKYKKGMKWTVVGLLCAVALGTVFACFSNKFIIFPLFGVTDGMLGGLSVNKVILTAVLPFNIIKTSAVALIVLVLHRRVLKIIKRF